MAALHACLGFVGFCSLVAWRAPHAFQFGCRSIRRSVISSPFVSPIAVPTLNNPEVFGAILKFCDLHEDWQTLAAVVMPDHFHALVRPLASRDAKITQYSAGLKRFVRRETKTRLEMAGRCFRSAVAAERIGRIEMDLHAGKSRPRRAREALGRLAVRDRVSRVGRAILAAPGAFGSSCRTDPNSPGAAKMARPTRPRAEFLDRASAAGQHRWVTATSGPGHGWFWGRRSRRGSIPRRKRA